MTRLRAADDFAAIRARMEELKREREQPERNEDQEDAHVRRWRLGAELRARILPRRNWEP